MDRRVLRWEVPIDDNWHKIGGGPVVFVDARPMATGIPTPRVEVWTVERTPEGWPEVWAVNRPREVAVFGTGHRLDPSAGSHLGSVIDQAVDGRLVWHVFERK